MRMSIPLPKQSARSPWLLVLAAVSAAALGAGAVLLTYTSRATAPEPSFRVSQVGRAFAPDNLTVKRGATVAIINDDGKLRHHAYIDADRFKFDSGDQEPGSRTDVTFSVPGTFDVLCGIHPKMKLTVTVE